MAKSIEPVTTPADVEPPAALSADEEIARLQRRLNELEAAKPPAPWEPPEGYIVTNDRNYIVWIGGQRYEHVSEAPDGRWVYRPS